MSFLSSIFGSRPNYGGVQTPYQQVNSAAPANAGNANLSATNITSELEGNLPAGVQSQIKNYGAAWGIGSGMPGSGAANNVTLESLGLNSLQEQQKGQSDYLSFVTSLGNQMMPVADQMTSANAAAAPSPAGAGLWDAGLGLYGTLAGETIAGEKGGGYGEFNPDSYSYSF